MNIVTQNRVGVITPAMIGEKNHIVYLLMSLRLRKRGGVELG